MNHPHVHRERRFKLRYIFIALLFVLMVWFGIFRWHAHNRLDQRIDDLRAQGYPMSLMELDKWYTDTMPPDADNAAPYYQDAFAAYVKWNEDDYNDLPLVGHISLPKRTETLDAQTFQSARDFLSDNQETLELLYEAAKIPHCLYPRDFSQGFNMRVPWLSESRQCAFLLSLNALVSIQQGDVQASVTSIKATFALARSLRGPLIIQHLVQIAIKSLAYASLEQVLSRSSLSQAQLLELSGIIEDDETDHGYKNAMVGERCFGLHGFQLSSADMSMLGSPNGGKQGLVMFMLIPRKILGLHDLDTLSYVNMMQAYIDASSLPYDQGLIRCQEIDQHVGNPQNLGMIARLLMPALGRTFQLQVRYIAHTRTALTALAIERYRLSQGTLPQSLDELMPTYLDSIPKDPFDGQNLRYHLLETGYVVYSIGEDLTDDNGKEHERQRGSQQQPWDVTFTVVR